MAGKTRPKTLPGHRTELGQPNLSNCSRVDAKSRDATRSATSRQVSFPRRPKSAVAAPSRWRHGSGRGWFSPHGLVIRVVRALIGWQKAWEGDSESAVGSLLIANFQEIIYKNCGSRKTNMGLKRQKIYNYCCSGLRRKTCRCTLGSHTLYSSFTEFLLSLLPARARRQGAGADALMWRQWRGILLHGVWGDGFAQVAADKIPFCLAVYGFISKFVKDGTSSLEHFTLCWPDVF